MGCIAPPTFTHTHTHTGDGLRRQMDCIALATFTHTHTHTEWATDAYLLGEPISIAQSLLGCAFASNWAIASAVERTREASRTVTTIS